MPYLYPDYAAYDAVEGDGAVDYERAETFDTADAVVTDEIAVELLDPADPEELQWYANELRRVCGDDVTAEELELRT